MNLVNLKALEKRLNPQTQKMLKGKTLKQRIEIVERILKQRGLL
jgi:hypothetical protein